MEGSRLGGASRSPDMAAAAKKQMRRQLAAALRALPDAEVAAQSQQLAEQVALLPEFARARGVSVYLEMPKEAATGALLAAAFAARKTVYVPKILGKHAEDMQMLRAASLDDIRAFPKDKWQIPDPTLAGLDGTPRADALERGDLDLVLLPGVGFDRAGGRLGHGKGYYDCFLRRLGESYAASDRAPPTTIGLCLAPQLVEQVPLSPHDRMLDLVVTPSEVIRITPQ